MTRHHNSAIYFIPSRVNRHVVVAQTLALVENLVDKYQDLEFHIVGLADSQSTAELIEHPRITYHLWTSYGPRSLISYLQIIRVLITTYYLVFFRKASLIFSRGFWAIPFVVPLKVIGCAYIVLDLRGVSIEQHMLRGLIDHDAFFVGALYWLQGNSFCKTDHIFCVSKQLAEYVRKNSDCALMSPDIDVVPCCVSPDFYHQVDWASGRDMKHKLGLSDKLTLVYAGSISAWNVVGPMLEVYQWILANYPDECHFLFLTPHTQSAQQKFSEANLDSNHYTIINVPQDSMPLYLSCGDVGLLLREKNIVNKVASPVKFGEYLASGLPVLVTEDIGDTGSIVEKYQVGKIISGGNLAFSPGLVKWLNKIVDNRYEMYCCCRDAAYNEFFLSNYLDKYTYLVSSAYDMDNCGDRHSSCRSAK